MSKIKKRNRINIAEDEVFLDQIETAQLEEHIYLLNIDKQQYLKNTFIYFGSGHKDANSYFLIKNIKTISKFNKNNEIFIKKVDINKDYIDYEKSELIINFANINKTLNFKSKLQNINILENLNQDIFRIRLRC